MASAPYDQTDYDTLGYSMGGPTVRRDEAYDAPAERSVGEHVFIWIAWAAAAFFWGVTMSTFVGIIHAVGQPAAQPGAAADTGGVGFLLMDVVGGLVVLGLAMAVASAMVARRNRRLDPVTEAATADLYDEEGRRNATNDRRPRDLG